VTVATACVLQGSPAARVAKLPPGREKTLSIEHPTGEFSVMIEVGGSPDNPVVERASLLRTARLLFDGYAFARENAAPSAKIGRDPT
jgi:4-oxalomesaconate tautomerase